MKKQFLFAMAAVAMLASCSNDDVVSNNGIDGDKSGRQEVMLGAGQGINVEPFVANKSRASIESDRGWKGNTEIGVFGLNRVTGADWTTSANVLINNQKATVNAAGDALTFAASVYYPFDNTPQYAFYAYHPVQAPANITTTTNKVTCTFTLDGTQDIMWGSAMLATGTSGYNHQYIVANPGNVPTITFNHLLSRFKFHLVASGTDIAGAKAMKIKKIEIINVKTAAELTIADRTDVPATNRILAFTGTDNVLTLKDQAGTAAATVNPGDAPGTLMGESMLLPAGVTSYTAKIYVSSADDKTNYDPIVRIFKRAGGDTFVAGASYKVNIPITKPLQVEVKTILATWGTDEEIN